MRSEAQRMHDADREITLEHIDKQCQSSNHKSTHTRRADDDQRMYIRTLLHPCAPCQSHLLSRVKWQSTPGQRAYRTKVHPALGLALGPLTNRLVVDGCRNSATLSASRRDRRSRGATLPDRKRACSVGRQSCECRTMPRPIRCICRPRAATCSGK